MEIRVKIHAQIAHTDSFEHYRDYRKDRLIRAIVRRMDDDSRKWICELLRLRFTRRFPIRCIFTEGAELWSRTAAGNWSGTARPRVFFKTV